MDFYPNNRFNERELSKRGAYEISIVEQSFITVGIGASAGGLEAFKVLFEFISVDAGLSSSALNETVTFENKDGNGTTFTVRFPSERAKRANEYSI